MRVWVCKCVCVCKCACACKCVCVRQRGLSTPNLVDSNVLCNFQNTSLTDSDREMPKTLRPRVSKDWPIFWPIVEENPTPWVCPPPYYSLNLWEKKLHLEFCKILLFLFWRRSSQKMLRSSFQMENILEPKFFFTKIQKAVISHFGIFKEIFELILVWSLFLGLHWQKVDHFICQVICSGQCFCWKS